VNGIRALVQEVLVKDVMGHHDSKWAMTAAGDIILPPFQILEVGSSKFEDDSGDPWEPLQPLRI